MHKTKLLSVGLSLSLILSLTACSSSDSSSTTTTTVPVSTSRPQEVTIMPTTEATTEVTSAATTEATTVATMEATAATTKPVPVQTTQAVITTAAPSATTKPTKTKETTAKTQATTVAETKPFVNTYEKGIQFTPSAYDLQTGKVVTNILPKDRNVVIIWQSFCQNCLDELAIIQDIYSEYSDLGFVGIGVGDTEEILDSVKEQGLTFPNYAVTSDFFNELREQTSSTPTIFYLDKNGKEFYRKSIATIGIQSSSSPKKQVRDELNSIPK